MKISMDQVTDTELSGVDIKDYPDFCDAYFSSAVWKHNGEPLSDEELDALNDSNWEAINIAAHESLQGRGEE